MAGLQAVTLQSVGQVTARFVRFRFSLQAPSGSDATAGYDLHVVLDQVSPDSSTGTGRGAALGPRATSDASEVARRSAASGATGMLSVGNSSGTPIVIRPTVTGKPPPPSDSAPPSPAPPARPAGEVAANTRRPWGPPPTSTPAGFYGGSICPDGSPEGFHQYPDSYEGPLKGRGYWGCPWNESGSAGRTPLAVAFPDGSWASDTGIRYSGPSPTYMDDPYDMSGGYYVNGVWVATGVPKAAPGSGGLALPTAPIPRPYTPPWMKKPWSPPAANPLQPSICGCKGLPGCLC